MTAAPANTRPLPLPRDERWDDAAHVARYEFHVGHPDSGRCGNCGLEIVGPPTVRGRWIYCSPEHAALYETVVYEEPVWVEVDGVWTEVFDPAELAASGTVLCSGAEVSRG